MKVMATFDGTPFSEATLPLLLQIAELPDVEFTLMRIGHEPHGRRRGGRRLPVVGGAGLGQAATTVLPVAEPQFTETRDQAIDRRLAEIEDYLLGVARQLSASVKSAVEAHVSDDVARTIIDRARREQPDFIVMATHSRHGIAALFGSTTEQVVRSGVAPVLLVHPKQ